MADQHFQAWLQEQWRLLREYGLIKKGESR